MHGTYTHHVSSTVKWCHGHRENANILLGGNLNNTEFMSSSSRPASSCMTISKTQKCHGPWLHFRATTTIRAPFEFFFNGLPKPGALFLEFPLHRRSFFRIQDTPMGPSRSHPLGFHIFIVIGVGLDWPRLNGPVRDTARKPEGK